MDTTNVKHYTRVFQPTVVWDHHSRAIVSDFLTLPDNLGPGERASRTEDSRGWYGTTTMDSYKKMVDEGWAAGTKGIDKIIQRLGHVVPPQQAREVVTMHDRVPHNPARMDAVAYITGQPAPWLRPYESDNLTRGSKMSRVLVNIGNSSGVSANTIKAKGQVIMALVQLLESAGITTEITAAYAMRASSLFSSSSGILYMGSAVVKEAGEPWMPGRVASIIGHPSGTRRFAFSLIEGCSLSPNDARKIRSSYGYPKPISMFNEEVKKHEPHKLMQYDIVIESDMWDGSQEWLDATWQQQWLLNQLKAQGFEVA